MSLIEASLMQQQEIHTGVGFNHRISQQSSHAELQCQLGINWKSRLGKVKLKVVAAAIGGAVSPRFRISVWRGYSCICRRWMQRSDASCCSLLPRDEPPVDGDANRVAQQIGDLGSDLANTISSDRVCERCRGSQWLDPTARTSMMLSWG